MSLYLRAATDLADYQLIEELSRAVWRERYARFVSPAEAEHMLARRYAARTLHLESVRRGVRYDCAFEGQDLIGYAAYGPVAPLLVRLHMLDVHEDWRRQGVGRALLERALEFARTRSAGRIALVVDRRNETAIAAYRRWGFSVTGRERLDAGEGFPTEDLLMERPVHPPAAPGPRPDTVAPPRHLL